ncbi:DUF932 domain-containing protein [Variovorax sp. V35]|uniref:DUF932 domain-containing protein n=1 Tax=Variovorax sp. V35 TaxID=3065956 RepID=UPI0034E885B9
MTTSHPILKRKFLHGTPHRNYGRRRRQPNVSKTDTQSVPRTLAARKVLELYEGRGRGAELAAARGTAWGLLSAMTEYVDHERRARSREYRLDSAWFAQDAALKQRALDRALALTT